jgi:ribosomal RNA-processing protein 8
MPLFDVPGWSLTADPVAPTSKKRKRPKVHNDDKLHNAEINLEQLMGSLKGEDVPEMPKRKRHKGKKHDLSQERKVDQGSRLTGSGQKPLQKNKGKQDRDLPTRNKSKGSKRKIQDDLPAPSRSGHDKPPANIDSLASERNGLTTLQHDMKQKLHGARFRYTICICNNLRKLIGSL